MSALFLIVPALPEPLVVALGLVLSLVLGRRLERARTFVALGSGLSTLGALVALGSSAFGAFPPDQ